ncbi:HAD-superfamily subfamily IIA hydrolase [Zalerion maritima]|uniref:HAD-superfamily subfamily IIA hydrolase n=1 Tax=Zalerion maritima TaxID=339359 RepID=A0AAD5WRT6_9PEZI|nr:HAD-superfamily subfamily IIA hydrolase [Zalerion maritima]
MSTSPSVSLPGETMRRSFMRHRRPSATSELTSIVNKTRRKSNIASQNSPTKTKTKAIVTEIPTHSTMDSASKTPSGNQISNFGFAFDIDGVLMQKSTPIPGASECLRYLHDKEIPFILLTNGGGKTESARIQDLSEKLKVPLTLDNFVQAHTPFRTLEHLKGKTILVTGGDPIKCREISKSYGFKSVVIPGDLHVHHRSIWPFHYYPLDDAYRPEDYADDLPKPVREPGVDTEDTLKIDAIFVFNDPRDWALDIQIITDLLISRQGYLGTRSNKNGDKSLPNAGWQQDGQPQIYFSHQDLHWSTGYHMPRLGQGAFQGALCGVWDLMTKGKPLVKTTIGKPHAETYFYAERVIHHYRKLVLGEEGDRSNKLKRVWMVGDNTNSDIKGANDFSGKSSAQWPSMLVRTGVWHPERDGEPNPKPTAGIFDDVMHAVKYALEFETKELGKEGKDGWTDF